MRSLSLTMTLDKQNLDKKVVSRSKIRSKSDTKEMYNYFYQHLFGICLRYASDRNEALSYFNYAMLEVFQSLEKRKDIENQLSWAAQIIRRRTIDEIRKKTKFYDHHAPEQALNSWSDTESTLSKLAVDDIMKCIQKLDTRMRTIFSMYCIDGFSHKEIASKLNISISNSKYLLHQAKKTLQSTLKNEYHGL